MRGGCASSSRTCPLAERRSVRVRLATDFASYSLRALSSGDTFRLNSSMTLAETTKNLLEIGVLAFGLLAAIRPIRESHLVEQLAPQHFVVIGSVKTITRKDQPGYK